MGWTKEEDQLWDAARDGKDGEIERLIDAGTHVDCAHPGRSDTTPLMTAARYANLSSVKLLVRCGADVNMKSRWGRTALDDARKYTKQPRIQDKRDVIAFLEDAGQVASERAKGVAEKKAKVAALLKAEGVAANEAGYTQGAAGGGIGRAAGAGRMCQTPQRGDTSTSGAAARTTETTESSAAEDGGC